MNSGIIIKKWARGNYPANEIEKILEEDPEIITAITRIEEHLFAEISLFVILCLIMIIRFTSKIIYNNSLLKKVIKKPAEEETSIEQ